MRVIDYDYGYDTADAAFDDVYYQAATLTHKKV